MKKSKFRFLLSMSFLSGALLLASCTSLPSLKDSKGETTSNDIMLAALIPYEFVCLGSKYIYTKEQLKTLESSKMVGYLVNENELDYWKKQDNNDEFIYALDMGNGTYRNEAGVAINRFELYAQNETYDSLALETPTGNFMLYDRQGDLL